MCKQQKINPDDTEAAHRASSLCGTLARLGTAGINLCLIDFAYVFTLKAINHRHVLGGNVAVKSIFLAFKIRDVPRFQ